MTNTIKTESLDLPDGTEASMIGITLDEATAKQFHGVMKALPEQIERIEIVILLDAILNAYRLKGRERVEILHILAAHDLGMEIIKQGAN